MQLSEELSRLFTVLGRVTADHDRNAVLARPDYLVLGRLCRVDSLRPGDLAQLNSTLEPRLGIA